MGRRGGGTWLFCSHWIRAVYVSEDDEMMTVHILINGRVV